MSITTLGNVDDYSMEQLKKTMLYSFSTFKTHRTIYDRAGISLRNIQEENPLEILKNLPVMTPDTLESVSNESISVCPEIIDIETSSGTTGTRKRRFITPHDDLVETNFLARLFSTCRIGKTDSVACVDTGPLTLMASFTKALEKLGIEESYAYFASINPYDTAADLSVLKPTVIITIPSILDRLIPFLTHHFRKGNGHPLEKVIYVGEMFADKKKKELEDSSGIEIFSYYGASETSALGIECVAHQGIHLFTDQNLFEVRCSDNQSLDSDILITTLNQEGLPLLRYPLNDTVVVKPGSCTCGLLFPRVDITGRSDCSTSILGVNISFESLLNCAYQNQDCIGPMEVVLTKNPIETLTITLPSWKSTEANQIRNRILSQEPDLTYLIGANFFDLRLAFENVERIDDGRKKPTIQDRRNDISATY